MKTKFLRVLTSFLLVFAFGFSVQAQTVSGTVTDDNGVPLPGATVVIEGSSDGVSTDFDGNYSINASSGDILVFSFVGYQTVSTTVGSSTTVDAQLSPDSALDEVVVTALGISRSKKSLGYGITELSDDQVNTVKDFNIANSLAGKVPGLNLTQSGTIGAGARIVIRGNNSLGGNTQALVVVDGIPINQDGINSGGSVYNNDISGGGISDINPNDVESISVLKGPNAAALYGSRAGNGVILITTKKGKSESGMGVTINSNTTFDNPMFLPKFQNSYGQGTAGNAATVWGDIVASSWGPTLDGSSQLYFTGENKAYTAQPDNVKNFFETGVKSINSIAVEASSGKTNYRFSYTNNNTTSILPNAKLESHNFNIRANTELSDKLSIDTKATYYSQVIGSKARSSSEGIMPTIYGMPRNTRVADLRNYQDPNPASDRDYFVRNYDSSKDSEGKNVLGSMNPYWMLFNDIDDDQRGRFLGFTKINYKFNDWLSGFVRVGADITNVNKYWVRQPGHASYPQGRLQRNSSKSGELNSEFLLTANTDLTEGLNMVLNLGGNLSKRTYEAMSNFGDDFKLKTKDFLANTLTQTVNETPQQVKKVNSAYLSANFGYEGWAYLDVTARNDWSSTLGADNRSYFYTSVNAAVLLQDYIDPNNTVFDLFKVRASVANVGNDTSPYQLVQTFSVPGQGYLNLTTLNSPSTRLNPNLLPENIESTEFGLEFAMFNNKLNFDVSIYDIKTTDLIFNVPVPAATGYNNFLSNVGEVTNKGVEVNLGGTLLDTGSVTWNSSLFWSKNDNKLVSLIDDIDTLVYFENNNQPTVSLVAKVGGGIGDIYGTVWDKNDAGQHLVTDTGRAVESAANNYLGNAQPDWLGGWNNTIMFDNFAVNFLVDARYGGQIFINDMSILDGRGVTERTLQYRETGVILEGVDSAGVANTASMTGQEYWGNYSSIAENYVYDQTNIRLREFSVGYNFPNASSLGFENINVSLIGRNLFFFYNAAEGFDPEATLGTNLGGQGYAMGNLPTTRSLGLNLTLKF